MLGLGQQVFTIAHASDISTVRRYAAQLGRQHDFSELQAGRLAIIVTEAATNILKHAGDGIMLITPVTVHGKTSIEMLALDRGKGIANIGRSLLDGVSTSGTQGTGLGAMKRLSQSFESYTAPGKGSAFYVTVDANADTGIDANSEVRRPAATNGFVHAGICTPIVGEEECGDAWAVVADDSGLTIVVADGLGHGPQAAQASDAAVQTVSLNPGLTPAAQMEQIHRALRPTRGAAVAVARIDTANTHLTFGGIGNISASVQDGESRRQLVSHNGIVGHNMRKVQEFSSPWPAQASCILCSDGIATQWDIASYPGLTHAHPALIAGVIYRDFSRHRDDTTVLVVKRLG